MVHCYFENGSQNQHFQSALSVGREGAIKKSTGALCTFLIMLTILDEPYINMVLWHLQINLYAASKPGMFAVMRFHIVMFLVKFSMIFHHDIVGVR